MAETKSKSKIVKYCLGAFLFVLLVAIVSIILVGYQPEVSDDDPNITTISTGTQGRFGNIDVALGDINGGTAFLYLHQTGTNNEQKKKVVAGDKFEAFGYEIEVKSINKSFNPSTLIGANHGNIKLLINKK